jgi:hypothetical protein
MTAEFITDFWRDQYLDQYIAKGGSKIKFLTGSAGSGKSHLLSLFLDEARNRNFKTVSISAKTTWIHDFKEIYVAALDAVDITECLKLCTDHIIKNMGYQPDEIPEGMSFTDFLSDRALLDPITKRELRTMLNDFFFKNPQIDMNFAIFAALITGDMLGYPTLEPASLEMLMSWLRGEKGVRLPALRKLGLSPSRITKYNARHMLRSLVEIVHIAGYQGLVIGIDDLEILTSTSSLEEIRYTKMRREDAFESIRELIDEIDTLSKTMFVFTFDHELLEDEAKGLKSYQALWMRIQNEIEGSRVNRFSDIIDMDIVAKQTVDGTVRRGA